MADSAKKFVKHGSLRTKITIRSILWFVQNCSDVWNERKNIRSDIFRVSTLPNCLFYLALTADANIFTIYVNRCVSNTFTCKTSEYTASILISLEDTFNNLHFTKELIMTKDTLCVSSSYDQNVARNFLMKGSLHVHCSVTVEEAKLTDLQKKFENLKQKLWSHCSAFSTDELKEHIGILLDGDASNKVIISVDDEDFPVHKTLLCSHSPVFSAMFSHETLESHRNHIFINDIRKEVIGEMLKYIYTGSTTALSPLMNIELFIAADKYGIFSLKERCSRFLASSLNQESVLDIIVLSHQYVDNNLKSTAIQYLIEKASNLLESEEFLLFIESECEIVQHILLTLIKHIAK